jgi:probable addiction module antidote protein
MARPKDNAKGTPHDFAVAYLNVLIDDADEEELAAALGRLARASGGPKLVEKVELSAPSFYRTLCRRGNPELKSVAALLKAMGIRLALQPLSDANRRRHAADRYAGHRDAGRRYAGQPIQHLRARRQMDLEEDAAWP